jgi:hypothetical protein
MSAGITPSVVGFAVIGSEQGRRALANAGLAAPFFDRNGKNSSPRKTWRVDFSGVVFAVWHKSAAAQGPAGGTAHSAMAGWDYDLEEPDGRSGGETVYRSSPRRGEAMGEADAVAHRDFGERNHVAFGSWLRFETPTDKLASHVKLTIMRN